MEIYDNGGWNIYGDNVPSSFCVGKDPAGEFTCRLENGGLGNMNINPKSSSGSGYMLEPTRLKSDGSVYYVYPGKEVCISPQSSSSWTDDTDWLEGCMVFDTQNYVKGAAAAYVPEENIRTTSDQEEDTWNFVRTHFFAAEKGWVIQYDKNAPANMSAHPLVFAEGCNVTYDYKTNGGTGMSETYSKITCLAGEAVDLSLTADRPGYEFIGSQQRGLKRLRRAQRILPCMPYIKRQLISAIIHMTPTRITELPLPFTIMRIKRKAVWLHITQEEIIPLLDMC